MPNAETPESSQPGNGGGGGPNVGAIAGGVIGGVVAIAVLIYLAWRFFIKPKRAEETTSQYGSGSYNNPYGSEKDAAAGLGRRGSTHTVHSIASTVLTRASNIIQIAYIPGVTNRANPSSGGHVPPVPPIPMEHSNSGDSVHDDQHFFMPGDLRDSTYSGLSGYTDRTSFARTSYAPRSSVASTIYGKQAQIVSPSQTGMRVKPTMVSVKAMGTSGDLAPPVPTINLERFGDNRRDSQSSNFSVGSTFLNTATQARAHIVRVGSGLKKVEIGAKSDANSTKSSLSNPHAIEKDVDERGSGSITLMHDSGAPPSPGDQGPFSDPPTSATPVTIKSTTSPKLGAVMEAEPEEEQRAASATPQRSVQRATSPFSDEHATK
jgi:protein OPY2